MIKIIPIILIILTVVGYYHFTPWRNLCDRQISKVKGIYYIYLGDKAFQKSKEINANISKEYSNAVKFYNKGLREYPEHYQARCNLANIYVLFENYSEAIEQYKLALKYKPDYLECRMDFGNMEFEELSRYDDAIQQYKEVIEIPKKGVNIPFIYNNKDSINENKINAHYNTGLSYREKTLFIPKEKLKDNEYLKEAVKSYNRAVEAYNKNYKSDKKRNNYDMLYNLGLTHHLLGNTKEAGLNYCKAINAAPLNYEAHLNLGILLNDIKEYDEAIKEFTKAGMLVNDDDYTTIIYLNDLLNDTHKKSAIMKEIHVVQKNYENNFQEQKNSFWALFKKKEQPKEEQKNEESNIIFKDGKVKLNFPSENEFKNNVKKCESETIFKEMP